MESLDLEKLIGWRRCLLEKTKIASYTSASTYPVKVLQDAGAVDRSGNILPRHIQLCITNKCNLQ